MKGTEYILCYRKEKAKKEQKVNLQKLSDGEDIAAPSALGSDADKCGVHHPVPAGGRQDDVLVHIRQDLRPHHHQIPVLNTNPRPYRHLRPPTQITNK